MKKYQNLDTFKKFLILEDKYQIRNLQMLIESQGKLEKSQGKVREKSGNSVSKIWQTP